MDDKFSFTLKSPITDEQWDKIMDVDFEHTDRIWFETKHGKVEFVKASAQPEQKVGKWLLYGRGTAKCSQCGIVYIDAYDDDRCFNYCPNYGAKMEGIKIG